MLLSIIVPNSYYCTITCAFYVGNFREWSTDPHRVDQLQDGGRVCAMEKDATRIEKSISSHINIIPYTYEYV